MSSSTSSPTNTTQTSTEVSTNNLNASGNTGPTNVGGGNLTANTSTVNNIVQSDSGAIAAATQLANLSTGLGASALKTAEALNVSSNNFAGQTISTYTGAVSDLASQFATGLSTLQAQEQTQLGNTVSALNQIAVNADTSANQQVINAVTQSQESFQQIVKYVAIAATVAIVGYLLIKKG